jgi:hypothetical protein
MTTRRELTQAVVEAARKLNNKWTDYGYVTGNTYTHSVLTDSLRHAVRALDACTEPDLDALDAAVVQAVEMHDEKLLRAGGMSPRLRQAALDYRAALKPRARYEATNETCSIFDRSLGYHVRPSAVATLLNAKEAAK